MRITCPTCQTEYEVADLLLSPGARVRCAQCQAEWVAIAEATAREAAIAERLDSPAPPAEPRLAALERPDGRRQAPVRTGGTRAPWIIGLAVVVAVAACAFIWRGELAGFRFDHGHVGDAASVPAGTR